MMRYLIAFLYFLSIIYSIENIALVIKKKGDVEHKKFNSSQFNTSVYRNKSLYNDDVIRTGEDGFTKVVYFRFQAQKFFHLNFVFLFLELKLEYFPLPRSAFFHLGSLFQLVVLFAFLHSKIEYY